MFEETTGLPSSDKPVARVQGVGPVDLLIICRAELPAGKLRQGGGQIVNVRCSPTEDQVPVIRITSIQSNVLLLDGKVQGVPVTVVVDCGSPICILSNEVFDCIGLGDTVGRVRSKLSSTRTKVWGSSVQQ